MSVVSPVSSDSRVETSSPATLALARANSSSLASTTKCGSLKRTAASAWGASNSLQSMLALKHMEEARFLNAVVEKEEEDAFSFPSIGWNLDGDDLAGKSVDPANALSSALAILKEKADLCMPQAKRRRMGQPSGMVRSKAMKSELSSLAASTCSSDSRVTTPLEPLVPKFFDSVVSARDVATELATCSLKTSASFVDTTAVATSSLLTV